MPLEALLRVSGNLIIILRTELFGLVIAELRFLGICARTARYSTRAWPSCIQVGLGRAEFRLGLAELNDLALLSLIIYSFCIRE